jgi:TetR/AcrR family transcriptional regulator, regulator of autoinduction and epiphytic fitness
VQPYVHCALVTTAPVAEPRKARKTATRDAIADALLDLLAQGNLRPTAREIAQRAGTSLRSVYVHFDDLEDLFCVAAKRHFARVAPMLGPIAATGPLPERAAQFVRRRIQLYAQMGGVGRATQLQAPFSPTLARIVRDAHTRSRREIENVFAIELARLDPQARSRTTAAVDAISGATAWETLRSTHELAVADAERTVVDAIVTLLEAGA